MMSKLFEAFVGDEGTAIILDCGANVSSAVSSSIEVQKPDGEKLSWPAEIFEINYLMVVTESDTLDMPGRWKLQSKVILPSGQVRGKVVEILVRTGIVPPPP